MSERRKSGASWSEELSIPILEPKGWNSMDAFQSLLITKEEFCNRASNSTVKMDKPLTRRAASEVLQAYKRKTAELRQKEAK